MGNNFFNDSNKAYSENLNDGILVGNAFDWTVDVSLPSDTDGVFPSSSDVVMAKVADVSITPNSNLSIGSTIENNSSSSQVYRLTVYPNFNRFGGFKSISLTADSGVTFYIANKGGTSPIASNLDYDDLGNVPELKVLKEYDIVLTIPKNKGVTGLEFVFQSSSADVSGVIDQENVSGLTDRLDSLESSTDNVVNINFYANLYSPQLNTSVQFVAIATDIDGNPIPNKSLTLKKNRTVVSSSTTSSSGMAVWSVLFSGGGVFDFSVNDEHVIIRTYGFEKVEDHTGGRYHLWVDKGRKIAMLELTFNSETFPTGDMIYQADDFIPSQYRPPLGGNIVSMIGRNYNLMCYIWGNDGTVGIANKGSTLNGVSFHNVIQWSYE
jgi:hypothetical protein